MVIISISSTTINACQGLKYIILRPDAYIFAAYRSLVILNALCHLIDSADIAHMPDKSANFTI
jgi:hypothetical protein